MSNFSLSSTTHRIIITYLCIVLGFLLIGFVVWTYFEYKTTELRLKGGLGQTIAYSENVRCPDNCSIARNYQP